MENLIKELEEVADRADAEYKKQEDLKDYISASLNFGKATGLRFAINSLKLQIALNGGNK